MPTSPTIHSWEIGFSFFRHLIGTSTPFFNMFIVFQKSSCSHLGWMTHISLRKQKHSDTNSSLRHQIFQYTCLLFLKPYFSPIIIEIKYRVPFRVQLLHLCSGWLPSSLKDFNPIILFLFLLHHYFFPLHWIISIHTHLLQYLPCLKQLKHQQLLLASYFPQLQPYFYVPLPSKASQKNDLYFTICIFSPVTLSSSLLSGIGPYYSTKTILVEVMGNIYIAKYNGQFLIFSLPLSCT